MCGIGGTIGLSREASEPALEAMERALRHRGPDGSGRALVDVSSGPPVGLVHTRLAIIDTSPAGAQPRRDPVTGSTLTFNGEIYNFADVRAELVAAGHTFESRTDTEVLLQAYRRWGPAALERLRGMFAFALVDVPRGLVWIARDRLGIKPLFLTRPSTGGLLFASEVRALLACGRELVPARLDAQSLESVFAQGMVTGTNTIAEGVRLLTPGTVASFDVSGRELSRRRYWQLPHELQIESRERAVRSLSGTLRDVVGLHLVADVPVGLFLSAGIDSASLAAVATEVSSTRVETLSVGFDVAELDESAEAETIARELGTEHRAIQLRGDQMLREIDEVFDAMDQPTIDGFNTYFVARAARRAGLTVALSGVGGDELFGGYASFRDVPRAARAGHFVPVLPRLGAVLRHVAAPTHSRALAKLAEAATRSHTLRELYLLRREVLFPGERRALHECPEGIDPFNGLSEHFVEELAATSTGRDPRNAISSLELSMYMRDMLLRDADVFSMAVGLELRVPLLDHVLVEQVLAMPGAWKKPDPRLKPMLVDAVGSRLPNRVSRGKKRGFTFPWDEWLRGPLRTRATEAIRDEVPWRSAGVRHPAVVHLWERYQRRDPSVSSAAVMSLWVLAEYLRRHPLARS